MNEILPARGRPLLNVARNQILVGLAEALLRKSVVPFLGAGFSYGARHPKNGWESKPKRMPEQIKDRLSQEIHGGTGGTTHAEKTLSNLFNQNSLCHLAELGHILFGATEVCEVLHIHEYAELRPEPQHRYLAYLVREGLVDEVLTTNYDCCLETALSESFFPKSQDHAGVVRNLEEYRQEGSQHASKGQFLLYKINGCARSYALARETYRHSKTSENRRSWDAEAKRIVLTERQLQSFRDQKWAKDVVRDRCRSRSLFFCGFGNDEPQIRHTVLTLLSEFDDGDQKSDSPEKAMDLVNAPYLHSFQGPLSFNQLQMMVAFMDANSVPRFSGFSVVGRILPLFRNVLGPENREEEFPASSLMESLFHEVFLKLVYRCLKDGEPFVMWLSESTPEWRSWRAFLRRIVNSRGAFRKQCCEFLKPEEGDKTFRIRFYQYVWATLYPGWGTGASRGCPEGWYVPLRAQPLLLLLVALWIALFHKHYRDTPQPTRFGLRLPQPSGGAVYLVAREALRELQTNGDHSNTSDSRLLRMIVLPRLRNDVDAWGRWRSTRAGHLRPGRWIAIESTELIREARRPQNVSQSLWKAFAAVAPRRPVARLRPLDGNKA